MSIPVEESSILNADIENDVTSSHRNLVETEPGRGYTTYTRNISFVHNVNVFTMTYFQLLCIVLCM